MSVDVIYLVESVPKELDVACIVRLLAKQRHGLRIEIASYKFGVPDSLIGSRPSLLIVPTCYAADAWGMRKHVGHWPGTPYLNLTWEELFCRANLTYKHPRDTFAQKHVQHHVWGDFYKNFLISHGVPAQHVFVNGHPGYRLYGSPYRDFFPTREQLALKHDLDATKKWIFLPENYGWAFYGPADVAGRIKDGMDPSTPPILREYCRTTLKTVLGWCQACARAGNVEMIIRPRPTTRLSDFQNVCQELHGGPLDGIRFIKDGTVNEWILASDVVVSSFSTSLLEASVAGKPAYMLEPLPLPDPLWSIWNDDADSLTTESEFLSACLDPSTLKSGQRLRPWADANLLANGDPIEGLVSFIAGVCAGSIALPPPPVMAPLTPRRQQGAATALMRKALNSARSVLAPNRKGDKHSMEFTQKDVSSRTKTWEKILARDNAVATAGTTVAR